MKEQALPALLLFALLCMPGFSQRVEPLSCTTARSMLLDFVALRRDTQHSHEVPVWRLPDSRAFFFVSGMAIDADGAPTPTTLTTPALMNWRMPVCPPVGTASLLIASGSADSARERSFPRLLHLLHLSFRRKQEVHRSNGLCQRIGNPLCSVAPRRRRPPEERGWGICRRHRTSGTVNRPSRSMPTLGP